MGRRLLLWLMLLCALSTGARAQTQVDFCTGEGTLGVWWWDSTYLRNEEAVTQRLNFLGENQVDEIYLCAGPTNNKAALRAFIQRCGEAGMEVVCLNGDASWILPESKGFAQWYAWFETFQQGSQGNQRFSGIQLDVEPHQLPGYAQQEQAYWALYADFVEKAAAQTRQDGVELALAIPFWLDNFTLAGEKGQEPLLDFLARQVDILCLMSYRDTAEAMLETAQRELKLPGQSPVKIVLGAETYSQEGNFVSYMEEGKAYMYAELAKLYQTLEEENLPWGWGLAIHSLETWMALQES